LCAGGPSSLCFAPALALPALSCSRTSSCAAPTRGHPAHRGRWHQTLHFKALRSRSRSEIQTRPRPEAFSAGRLSHAR
jgi:hypothetical protein